MKPPFVWTASALTACCCWCAPAQGPFGPPEPAPDPAAQARPAQLRLDLKAGKVSFDAAVCLRAGALELLVCKWGTKEHESILHTSCQPSHLHAALLALGLMPGKPARWVGGDDGRKPVLLSPAGPELKVTLHWKDQQGKLRQADADSWVARASDKSAAPPKAWIFIGSDVLPEGDYWADQDGVIISMANFASAVIDVPFRSTKEDKYLDFKANTDAIPPRGTVVRVEISLRPGARTCPDARATLEINPFGRMRIDPVGQMKIDCTNIRLDQLEEWAAAYVKAHPKGQVVIRALPQALATWVAQAREELQMGGVEQFQQQLLIDPTVLPRSADQLRRAREKWREKFDRPQDQIVDPAEEAAETLRQIDGEMEHLKGRRELLDAYRRELSEARRRYKASTQPAGGT